MAEHTLTTYTLEEWTAEAQRRFGPDHTKWRFVCPLCGNVASGQEFKDAGAEPHAMYQECIGRYRGGRSAFEETGEGPCDYAAYGLLQFAPVRVDAGGEKPTMAFAFAEASA